MQQNAPSEYSFQGLVSISSLNSQQIKEANKKKMFLRSNSSILKKYGEMNRSYINKMIAKAGEANNNNMNKIMINKRNGNNYLDLNGKTEKGGNSPIKIKSLCGTLYNNNNNGWRRKKGEATTTTTAGKRRNEKLRKGIAISIVKK
jgi:hypothetical protein